MPVVAIIFGSYRWPVSISKPRKSVGLSNTAMFSELLRTRRQYDRQRTFWMLPDRYDFDEMESFVSACTQLPEDPYQAGFNGDTSHFGIGWSNPTSLGLGLYNHALPPNSPGCFNGTFVPSAMVTAASEHDGVNVAFCDGHVRSVSKQISITSWREMGSR